MSFRTLMLVGAASVALLSSGIARAQEAARADEDIIVIADRANRSLKETSASVNVSTARDIASASGVYSVNNLLDRIPNIVTTEPGNDLPAIRGIDGTGVGNGITAFLAGVRPRLTYQVDGRTLSFNEAVFGDTSLWDASQVEVYRGPQSTLQGRNSIAGVIAVKTTDPSFAWHGAARAIVGNRDELQLSGAVGGPIVDDIAAFRVSADWQRSRSFLDFTPYPENDDPDRFDAKTFRGKLLLTPAPGVRSQFTLSYQDARQPQSFSIARPFTQLVPSYPRMSAFRTRSTVGVMDTSVALDSALSLELLLSAADFRIDRTAPAFEGNLRIDGREYVAQPLIRYAPADGALSGFLAAYVFRTHQDETIDLFGGGAYRDETDTTALFGEVTIRPAEPLSIILGARYEVEKRYRVGATGPLLANFRETYREFLPKATISLDVTKDVTAGITASRGYSAGGAGITFFAPFVEYTYRPEYVWNYEGFVRAKLSRDLSLTGNIFYNRYKDMQLPFYLSPLSVVIRNAERTTTYGAEAGLSWRPSRGNEVFANVGVLRTRINRYNDPLTVGNDLPRAPGFNLATGFNFSPDGKFELGADVRYTDGYFSDVLNDARTQVGAYTVVNGRLAYKIGPARLFFSVRNLLDSGKPVWIGLGLSEATDLATILEPRKISAGVELRF
ncbi:TonB-dependent receptor [Sphingomonas sp.]|uniref:TonB-dependent receptor n=1 Tax=Sphingomonas sp. TaxID=28214 RepID=UPI003D6CBB50